jgi:hypothetical protein
MPDSSNTERIVTGQVTFSGGVDSSKPTTIASQSYPDGLGQNQLAWLNNGTVRGGGITPRYGCRPLVKNPPWTGLYQGAYMYEPDGGNPYIVLSIGGRIYRARVDTDNSVEDLSAGSGLTNPADQPQSFWTQGEQFLVLQAGDLTTLPLFWDGTTLRRSVGGARVVGVTAANFTVPAVGAFVDVTLTAPYNGTTNQIIVIGAANYLEVVPDNFAVLKNISELGVGNTVPAGAILYDVSGNPVTTVLVDFTVPAVGASVNPIFVSPKWTGALPKNVTIDGQDWQITAVSHAPPAAKHVFLVNLTDTPTNVVTKPANLISVPELPAAGPMDYYMGRIWYAVGRTYAAGDIVKGPSGTVPYQLRDSILKITENPLAVSGDNFVVPTNAGNIRGISHTAELNTTLGQGKLYIGTRRAVYRLDVPVTRDEWSDPAFPDKQPLQVVAQRKFGFVGDRSVVAVNGDLWYQSVDGIRSLNLSVRNDQAWGNVPASNNISRAVLFNDRALLHYGSGIEFDNRLLNTSVPFTIDGVGVAHRGLVALDFDLISTLEQKKPPAWEGFLEGLDILQVLEADFGGLQRAFAVIHSRVTGDIEIWELTLSDIFDEQLNVDGNRIARVIEFPAYTWGDNFSLKQLETAEIWYDQLRGTVDFELYVRPDNYPCWVPWHAWQVCAAKNCTEDAASDCDPNYPNQLFCPGYEPSVTMPKPPPFCVAVPKRPVDIGYQFQCRLVSRGWNRIMGFRLHAIPLMKRPFENMVTCAAPLPIPQIAPVVTPNLFEDENGSVIFDEGGDVLDLGDDVGQT